MTAAAAARPPAHTEVRLQALAVLLLVPTAHWLYHAFPAAGWAQQWAQWCLEHTAGAIFACLLLPRFLGAPGWAEAVGVGGCAWMAVENAQCAVCGYLDSQQPNQAQWSQLCVQRFGAEPYVIALAGAAAFLILKGVKAWTGKAAAP